MTSESSLLPALADFLDIVDTALATLTRRLPTHVARDDLASIGKLALASALRQRSEPSAHVRAYCYVRVRGAMLDELRRLDPLTRKQREHLRVIARTQTELVNALGRAPSQSEVAFSAQLRLSEVTSAINAAVLATDATDVAWDTIADNNASSPAIKAEANDTLANMDNALARLPQNQAFVLRRYYLEDATLDDIGSELGVSRERARQIREAGEKKLRADFVVLSLWQALANRDAAHAT